MEAVHEKIKFMSNGTRELEGKVAFVTGGARGLGECLGRALSGAGAAVALADIQKELVESAAARLQENGTNALGIFMDVTQADEVSEAIQTTIQKFGRLDIVINNAGINVTLPIDELSVTDWDNILAVNLRGAFIVSKVALGYMKQQKSGAILNIVSTAAKRAWANAAAYHASKWGLLGFSHALHVEARKSDIKVTAVVCGGMRTPFLLEPFPDIDINTLQDPENVAQTIRSLLSLPPSTVIPEIMILPMTETSWP